MNAEQFRTLCDNRRARRPVGLHELPPRRAGRNAGRLATRSALASVLARARRAARQHCLAREAWQKIAPATWQQFAAIDGVEGDVLVIRVANTTMQYELHRQRSKLTRQLITAVPGVRSVRFAIGGAARNDSGPRQ